MKRHESLHALSRHHHYALIESLTIRRALQYPPEKRMESVRNAAERFLSFWEEKGKLHFREEEEILLPAYAAHIAINQDPDVMQMLADHASIRAKIARLAILMESAGSIEKEISELGQSLHDHVRFEENIVFPRIEQTLTESELQQIGRKLTELHPAGSCDL